MSVIPASWHPEQSALHAKPLPPGATRRTFRRMPNLELKPTEVRKSERLPTVVIVWATFCCAVLLYAGWAASGYNWKAAVLCAFPAMFFGYMVGQRFRITLK